MRDKIEKILQYLINSPFAREDKIVLGRQGRELVCSLKPCGKELPGWSDMGHRGYSRHYSSDEILSPCAIIVDMNHTTHICP